MSIEDEVERLRAPVEPEREISLGTATILGIFLLLALLCAGFFGFGYALGRRSAQSAAALAAAPATKPESPDSPFTNFKPAPKPAEPAPAKAEAKTQVKPELDPTPDALQARFPAKTEAATKPAGDAPAIPEGQFVVQVSAPSFQKDAEHLVTVLRQQGYIAFIRKQPGDQFFHVQVGPYATKPEAETARKQLEAAGYKLPFIK